MVPPYDNRNGAGRGDFPHQLPHRCHTALHAELINWRVAIIHRAKHSLPGDPDVHVRQFSDPQNRQAFTKRTRAILCTTHTDAHINLSTHNRNIHFTGNQICLIHCNRQIKKGQNPGVRQTAGKKRAGFTIRIRRSISELTPWIIAGVTGVQWNLAVFPIKDTGRKILTDNDPDRDQRAEENKQIPSVVHLSSPFPYCFRHLWLCCCLAVPGRHRLCPAHALEYSALVDDMR